LSDVFALSRRPGQIYANGRYLGKTIVPFKRKLKPGTILVKTGERALYYVLPGGKAIKYGVGVGREGFTWTGRHRITAKKEWPEWRPPEEMKQRELAKYGRKLPDVMPGGPKNPLGARALYIGNTLYRIHGTNNPRSIGKFVSSGCIRMLNEEVIDLYDRVKIGAPVIVEN
jgi:lipoprotein-anchoring transpeptidase ErfK/SrfK